MRPQEMINYFTKNRLNAKKLSQTLLGRLYSSTPQGPEYLATFFSDLLKLDGLQLIPSETVPGWAVTHEVPYIYIHKWVEDPNMPTHPDAELPHRQAIGIELEYDLDPRGATSDLQYALFTFEGLLCPIAINKWKL